MSTLTQFFGSGGGGGATGQLAHPDAVLLAHTSGTYILPRDGKVDIYCIGGGGGPMCPDPYAASYINDSLSYGTGGGGGGTAVARDVTVVDGDTLTVVIGAGGQYADSTNNTTVNVPYNNANAGGTSTVNSNNITGFTTLTANGGQPGEMFQKREVTNEGTANTNQNCAGGAGGNASGGTDNYSGGSGGSVTFNNNGVPKLTHIGTGGGSCGLNSNGGSGGNFNSNTANLGNSVNTLKRLATGGGGIRGNGGNINFNTTTATNIQAGTAGGGAVASAGNLNNPTNNDSEPGAVFAHYRSGAQNTSFQGSAANDILYFNGRGGEELINSDDKSGAGGAGCNSDTQDSSVNLFNSLGTNAPFVLTIGGGGGGSTNSGSGTGAPVTYGGHGGGGGSAVLNGNSANVNSPQGDGGSGIVMIVYKEN